MLKSMTGYGNSAFENEYINLKVEIKSVNSKTLDTNFYYPKWLTSEESRWRNIISPILYRGKISITIFLEIKTKLSSSLDSLSKSLFIENYNFLKALANEVNSESKDLFNISLRQTLESSNKDFNQELSKKDLKSIDDTILLAIKACDANRALEGEHLYLKFKDYISSIKIGLKKIQKFAPERLTKIRSKIDAKISELPLKLLEENSKNRFEQEILYYIEKLDIEEEIIRLDKHLAYFLEVMENKESYCGKKLGFILQEIGREVNTIGSKANNVEIQKEVVSIKEEIEKIKEQLLNIL